MIGMRTASSCGESRAERKNGQKERAPSFKGALPFCEATEPRLNPAADPASRQPPEPGFRREKLLGSYFFFFLPAFFFIALLRLDLDLVTRLRVVFLRPGIDTSSSLAAAGQAP